MMRAGGRGRRPVINVSQEDARSYAKWLSVQTGRRYRLPSQVEWEYAARAGTITPYSWGDEIGRNRANCEGCDSKWDNRRTAPVGRFEPNGFGLYDMHSNVWEWVEYCWHNGYAMVRGGSWRDDLLYLRSANHYGYWPSDRRNVVGFRLVQDLNP